MMRRKITPGYLYTVPSVQIEDRARWPLCSTPFIYERLHLLFNRTRGGGGHWSFVFRDRKECV